MGFSGPSFTSSVAALRSGNPWRFDGHLDGVTDDIPLLNSRIAAMSAAGGGSIYIPRGVVGALGTVVPAPHVQVFGEGVDAAVFRCLPAWSDMGPGVAADFVSAANVYDFSFSGCTIDQNRQNWHDPTYFGHVFGLVTCSNFGLENLRIINYGYPGSRGASITGLSQHFVIRDVQLDTPYQPSHGMVFGTSGQPGVGNQGVLDGLVEWVTVDMSGLSTSFADGNHGWGFSVSHTPILGVYTQDPAVRTPYGLTFRQCTVNGALSYSYVVEGDPYAILFDDCRSAGVRDSTAGAADFLVTAEPTPGSGGWLNHPWDYLQDLTFRSCLAEGGVGRGFLSTLRNAGTRGVRYRDCHATGKATGAVAVGMGFDLYYAGQALVDGCSAEHCATYGLQNNGDDLTISNFVARNNGLYGVNNTSLAQRLRVINPDLSGNNSSGPQYSDAGTDTRLLGSWT